MPPGGVNIADVWYFDISRTCYMCLSKYTNEREIMKNELRKMGVDELKLRNIVTRELESLFLYLKRTELFLWNG